MPTRLTFEELRALQPCGLSRHKALWGRRKYLTAAQALAAGASVDDLLWVAGRLGKKELCVRFALACAWRVAHLNPDPRVQAALDATQAWLDNPSDATRDAARRAKNATWDARAYSGKAGWAVGAAGNAAFAASVKGADWASGAARDAAWDALTATSRGDDWDARDAERQAQRKLFLEIFGGV